MAVSCIYLPLLLATVLLPATVLPRTVSENGTSLPGPGSRQEDTPADSPAPTPSSSATDQPPGCSLVHRVSRSTPPEAGPGNRQYRHRQHRGRRGADVVDRHRDARPPGNTSVSLERCSTAAAPAAAVISALSKAKMLTVPPLAALMVWLSFAGLGVAVGDRGGHGRRRSWSVRTGAGPLQADAQPRVAAVA